MNRDYRLRGLGVLLITLFVCGCVEINSRPAISSEDTKMIVDALIDDLPLPPDAKIRDFRKWFGLGRPYWYR